MLRTRTLRARLVALTLLLLAMASIVVGLVTTLSVRDYMVARLDDDVRRAASFAGLGAGQGGLPAQPGPDYHGPPRPPGDLFDALVSGGTVQSAEVSQRFASTPVAVPVEEYPTILQVVSRQEPTSITLGDLGSFRATAVATDGGYTVVGLSEARVTETVGRLIETELVVAALALVVAGVIGAVLVRRELAPLERVATTARRVSALPLDRGEVQLAERVPDADLRTEVGQVGAALNRMLDHVGSALAARQESETQLRQFVADASHELRTPLAAISGYAELTRRGPLPTEAAHALARIASQADRMTALVEDLLLLARLDAGRPLERAEVDLTRLVLDAVGDAHAAGPEHGWRLDLPEEPVSVVGDASRLTQVLTNLLANARTHTPPGTVVTVTLATEPEGARVLVVDDGPGIPAELLPHVFERFARGSTSRSREHGSTGLGLSIVHAVVAAHGGDVRVTSVPGRTEFSVALPFAAQAAATPPLAAVL